MPNCTFFNFVILFVCLSVCKINPYDRLLQVRRTKIARQQNPFWRNRHNSLQREALSFFSSQKIIKVGEYHHLHNS